MDLLQDIVHGILDGSGYRAVDGRGGRLVLLCTGIGGNTAGGDRTMPQRPEKFTVPGLTCFRRVFNVGKCTRDTLVGCVDVNFPRTTRTSVDPTTSIDPENTP